MSLSTFAISALLAGSSLVNAHMVMKTPKPFGNPNNSPLDPSGSDFPCKGGPYDRSSAQNVMAIGEPQTLSFTGSAVHGGGSCQVSLTTDLEPTKNSKWMVIKSIEGGCPASVAGNLPEDPNGSGASTFQYTIPEGIAPGEYVIAWSWLNKIGNREFYMNCGPATVTGAKKKRYVPAGVSLVRKQSSFPDMTVANIKSVNDCSTAEGFDYKYSSAGDDVEEDGAGPYTQLACGAAAGGNAAPKPTGAASPGTGSGTQPSGSPAAPSQAPGAGAGAGNGAGAGTGSGNTNGNGAGAGAGAGNGNGNAGGNSGGNFGGNGGNQGSPTVQPGNFATGAAPLPSEVSGGSGAGSDAGSSPAPPAAAPSSPAAPVAPAPPVTPPTTGGSSAGAQTGPCSEEGVWACSADGSAFQRCASGAWSAAIPMAAGMKCTPGTSVSLAMAASA